MEIQRTNDLVYTPYAMLAADTEKVVNALEDQFLNFGPDNDNTENMARLAWALFSRCSYTLPKKKKDGEQDARKKYEELCKEFSRECELYQKGELEYDFFKSRVMDYYHEFLFMKSLAGFRINQKEKKDYSSELAKDVEADLNTDDDSYEGENES